MNRLSSRDRRALTGLIAAAAIYLLATYIVFPQFDKLAASRTDVSQQEDQLRKYRRALLRKDQYGQLIQQASASVRGLQTRFFTPDKGSAELQSIVESTAASAGLVLSQRNPVVERKRDAITTEISINVICEATIAQVMTFLNQLRQSPKFLTVTSAQVGPIQPFREIPPSGELKKTLRTNFTVTGLVLNPGVGVQ
jgi:hypothetical protein